MFEVVEGITLNRNASRKIARLEVDSNYAGSDTRFIVSVKRYKEEDGTEDAPEQIYVTIENLQAEKTEYQTRINVIDALIADLGAL